MAGPPEPSVGSSDATVTATYAATLVDEWVRRGVTDAVVCPGSRSTPLAVAIARHRGLTVHIHHDERCGAFTALGLGLGTGRPAVVLTTSGTAAVELHPAVVEAHQASVPMIVVTADRPPELQGVHAPQTIVQRDLYGASVRWYCEPGPPEPSGAEQWRLLARDLVDRARAPHPGPVHLNAAFREPLLGEPGPLPPPIEADHLEFPRWGLTDEETARLTGSMIGRRGVIVAGVRTVASPGDRGFVLALAECLGWPVLADHLSGMRTAHPSVVTGSDPMLRHAATADTLRPEIVLHIGGLLASRVTNEWLARSGAAHIGIDRYGWCPDPDHVLGRSLHADVAASCEALVSALERLGSNGQVVSVPEGWMSSWRRADDLAAAAKDRALSAHPALSEPEIAAAALDAVPPGGALLVSSSMPVRDLEWYVGPARHPDVVVHSNRGANGIDGVTSTAVGIAVGGTPTVCLIGDVAFLHDTNALLGLAGRAADLLVVVIDNDGGGIFSFLPQADGLAVDEFELLFGTPHGVDLVALAAVHGVRATRVDSRQELDAAVASWAGRGTQVVVVGSDRDVNRRVHAEINAAVAAALDGS